MRLTFSLRSSINRCFPYQDFNNKFHNVIEASWHFDGAQWPEEDMANSRYNGVAPVADSGLVLNFQVSRLLQNMFNLMPQALKR